MSQFLYLLKLLFVGKYDIPLYTYLYILSFLSPAILLYLPYSHSVKLWQILHVFYLFDSMLCSYFLFPP